MMKVIKTCIIFFILLSTCCQVDNVRCSVLLTTNRIKDKRKTNIEILNNYIDSLIFENIYCYDTLLITRLQSENIFMLGEYNNLGLIDTIMFKHFCDKNFNFERTIDNLDYLNNNSQMIEIIFINKKEAMEYVKRFKLKLQLPDYTSFLIKAGYIIYSIDNKCKLILIDDFDNQKFNATRDVVKECKFIDSYVIKGLLSYYYYPE